MSEGHKSIYSRDEELLIINFARVDRELQSAVDALRDIAAMGKKAGSETAKNWLLSHGYALEEDGYIPGKGFSVVGGDVESGRQQSSPDSVPVDDAGTVTRTSPVNQCDGCRAGLPKRGDIHYERYEKGEEYPAMYCTARRYV